MTPNRAYTLFLWYFLEFVVLERCLEAVVYEFLAAEFVSAEGFSLC